MAKKRKRSTEGAAPGFVAARARANETPAEDVFQRIVGELTVSLGSIEVLRHAETLTLCVSFVVKSRIGEHTIRISVQDQSSLDDAVNEAREMLRYWAAGIQAVAVEPMFRTEQTGTVVGDAPGSR